VSPPLEPDDVTTREVEWSSSEGDVVFEWLDEDAPLYVIVDRRDDGWYLLWTDTGPNGWGERYPHVDVALARASLLIRAVRLKLFLAHEPYQFAFDWVAFASQRLS